MMFEAIDDLNELGADGASLDDPVKRDDGPAWTEVPDSWSSAINWPAPRWNQRDVNTESGS